MDNELQQITTNTQITEINPNFRFKFIEEKFGNESEEEKKKINDGLIEGLQHLAGLLKLELEATKAENFYAASFTSADEAMNDVEYYLTFQKAKGLSVLGKLDLLKKEVEHLRKDNEALELSRRDYEKLVEQLRVELDTLRARNTSR